MSRPSRRGAISWSACLGRLAASLVAVVLVGWLGQRSSVFSLVETPPRAAAAAQLSDISRSTTIDGRSVFSLDGLPISMQTRIVSDGDCASWTPREAALCADECVLLDLKRSPHDVVATWMTIEDSSSASQVGLDEASSRDFGASLYHVARLVCDGQGGGELVHTWMSSVQQAEVLNQSLHRPGRQPSTQRSGPVPLLEDSAQLLRFRNLDWTVYLDEPDDPSSSVRRFENEMLGRGWRAQEVPAAYLESAQRPVGQTEQSILVRDNELCLTTRTQIAARDLLLIACRNTT